MIPQSSVFDIATAGNGDVIVLSDGAKRILVQVPQTFDALLNLSKDLFQLDHDNLVFETDELTICRGSAVEIHSSSWEAVRSVIGILNVTMGRTVNSAGSSVRLPLAPVSAHGASVSTHIQPLSAKRPLSGRLVSPPPTADDDNDIYRSPSSLDEVEDDLHVDDDEDVPNPSPAKNKGKARARKQVLSSDEEEDESKPASKPLSARVASYVNSTIASPAGKVRGTPRDVSDLFSPNVKKERVIVKRTPVHDETEEEEEHDENVAPSPLRLAASRSAKAISKSANPEVRSVKKTPHKSGNYAMDDGEVSPSPRPKVSATTPGLKHAPVHGSSLRQSITEFEEKPAVEPLAPLRATTPLPDEKILITITHPETGNANKFKIKGKHLVNRVLESACRAFDLDESRAHLVLVEEVDGIEMTSECRRDHTMIKAGVKNESQLKLVVVDDEDEDEDEDGTAYDT